MYRVVFLIILFFVVSTVHAGSPDEISAIKKTAMNYMEAWYQGDAERMKGSLHSNLAKRSLREAHGSKKELRLTTASDMVSYTESGYGKNLWRENYNIEVIVLDFYKNIASVKVIAPHYLEYLHLVKIDEKWIIVNALYEKKFPISD